MKKKYLKKLIKKIIGQLLILVLITNSLMSFGAFSFAQEATNSAPLIVAPQPTPIEASTPTPLPTGQINLTPEPTTTPSDTIVPTPITTISTPTPIQSVEPTSNPLQSTPTVSPAPTIAPASQSPIDALQNFIKESSSSATLIDYAIKLPFSSSYPISLGFGEIPDDPSLQKEYESFGIIAHDGIDYELPDNTEVLASDLGIVLSSGPGMYGTTVVIYHTWGITYYGHLSSVSVEPGQIVETGELIGYSGHTGLTTGPHLHFGVKPKNPDLQNGFHGMVDPNIYLDPKPQSEILGISNTKTGNNLKVFRSNENPDIEFTINDKNLNYSLKDSSGKRIYVQKTITKKNNKKYFGISGVRDFRPGKYTLTMTNSDGEAEEQEFYWGVLAINTNKSVYLPGETAYLQMASLDDNGYTICDSKLELTINNEVLSTENGKIKYSDSCQGDNVTDSPDYYAYYQLNKTGIYQMSLKNLDNGFEINDSFEVKKSLPFEVERIGATRINPFKANYQITFNIKANQDFNGEIKEFVPDSFEILDPSSDATAGGKLKFEIKNSGNQKEIIWKVSLKKDEKISLGYQFKAPNISPQFYLLGPLQLFDNNNKLIFSEPRRWQIAADAAPDLPMLVPTAYSSTTGTAYTTTTVTNIDEDISSPDAAYIVAGANSTATIFYAITDTPADFVMMKTLNYNVRYKLEGNTNDTEVLYIQIFKNDKTTPLTNELIIGSTLTNIAIKNSGVVAFTGVSTTATKAEWDAAYVAIRTNHSANKGSDGSVWSIDTVNIIGTYDVPPTVSLTTPTDGATCQSTIPDLVFTGTDANGDTIEYNVQVDTVNTFDSGGTGGVNTYYFNDAAPTDPNSVWTSPANAFDGSTSTFASTNIAGSTSSNYLYGKGTNAPSSGNLIANVQARIFHKDAIGNITNAAIYTNALGELLGTLSPVQNGGGGWSSYITLNTPSGGWTWAKAQALETKIYNTGGSSSQAYRVEILVTTNDIPLLDVNSVDNVGFSGTGGPHPWPSGNAVTYSVSQKTADSWVDTSTGVMSLSTTKTKLGQSFTGDGGVLSSAGFYLNKSGSPTGNAVAKIYNMSGNWDTGDNIPTGSALAVSGNVDVTTLTGTSQLTIFTFSGADKITLVNGTHYVVSIEWVAVGADEIRARLNIIGGTHAGNYSAYTGGLWDAPSLLADLFFAVYTDYALDAGTTYYWRVRAKDPLGSNTWGEWSPGDNAYGYNSFTVGSCGPTTDQLMRHGKWFNSGTEQPMTF